MKIALAQINATIGDFDGNASKITALALDLIHKNRPDLLVLPELSLCGYPPMDLLDQEAFVEGNLLALRKLQRDLPRDLAVAFGFVDRNLSGSGKPLRNVLGVVRNGSLVFVQAKTLLPTYDVFDEARYFEPARVRRLFDFCGNRIGFAICEDIWWEAPPVPGLRYEVDPVKELLDEGAEILIVPSASPFHAGKMETRHKLAAHAAREGGVPVLYCNLVGSNDSLVFDGRSFAVDASGSVVGGLGWEEGVLSFDTAELAKNGRPNERSFSAPLGREDPMEEVEQALVSGIRDYLKKCGFTRACLGLSGGIDSALVAVLGAEAVGAENVVCISMPSRFSSEGSVTDSAELCRNIGLRLESIPIEGPFEAFLSILEPHFKGSPFGLTEENLQARIRGALLMSWSNKFDALLLTTGNKSELATGYCTLYGDMCGAIAPIGDLFKTDVFALARFINDRYRREGRVPPIPDSILTKAPSAELRPNQTDQDSLPPYKMLDSILSLYIKDNLALEAIIERGFEAPIVSKVITLVARSEYKRRQAAPVIKVSSRAFGTGRRIPIARTIHEARGG